VPGHRVERPRFLHRSSSQQQNNFGTKPWTRLVRRGKPNQNGCVSDVLVDVGRPGHRGGVVAGADFG
jgi:hypothetical protein